MNLVEYLKDPGIQQRLMMRVQNEYAATAVANFAMSEIGMLLEQEVASGRQQIQLLEAQNATLVEKTTADRETIATLRREIDDLKVKLGQPVQKKHRPGVDDLPTAAPN